MVTSVVGRTVREVYQITQSSDLADLDILQASIELQFLKEEKTFKNPQVLKHLKRCYEIVERERIKRWQQSDYTPHPYWKSVLDELF